MKKSVLSLFLILCTVFSLFAFASCNKRDKTTGTTATENPVASGSATEEATATLTTDKWEGLVPKVTRIAARDRQLKIECSVNKTGMKRSKNDIYLAGPDSVEDGVTPPIQQMVYERNKAANELFGTTIEYEFWDYIYGEQAPQIDLLVKGNATDAPDLFVNMIYDLNLELLNGSFRDVRSIPGSFFDFTTTGWLGTWMENMSLTGDRAYILGSDYFLDMSRAILVLPFNMTLMDENAVKLAPTIVGDGDPLGVGEKLSTRFFDLVDEGGWTYDVLGKLCEAIWVDEDGSGSDSVGDVLGIIADEYGGKSAVAFIYSCGEELTEAYLVEDPDSEYYNKQWIKYADTSEGLNRIFDAVKGVFEGAGSLSTNYTFGGNSPDKPGKAYHHSKFAAGELLFLGVGLIGDLEDGTIQAMTDLFSVVPCPTIEGSQDYNSIIDNTGDVGAMNVNSNPRKARGLSAYLQYCTENSGDIRDEFLETVTKYKTTTYNQGTDRMLDLIYEGVLYGRDKAVDDLFGTTLRSSRWHNLMKSQNHVAGADYISSQYESVRQSKQAMLDSYLAKWYTLPKVETVAN